MASAGGGASLFYFPEPHERAYFDGLFQAADLHRTGAIGGGDAVAFFSRSKLPLEQLKNVWTVADNPPSNSLDRPKFAVALRLIQLLQNGVKGQGPNLAAPPGVTLRPVFLEGISGASVPLPGMPPQQQQPPPQQQQQQQPLPQQPQQQPPPQQQQPRPQQQQPPSQQQQQSAGYPPQGGPQGSSPLQQQQPPPPQQPPQQQQMPQMNPVGRPPMVPQSPGAPAGSGSSSMALTVQDPYTLTPNERARYESLFPQYAKEDGYIHGKEAVELFSKSGLGQVVLRDIWNMADQPVDNRLDKLEFAIAMHLIVCVSKKNLPMPKALPFSLKTLKQQQQQQQQSSQPPGSPGNPSGISLAPSFSSQQPPSIPEPPQTNRMHTPTGETVMPGMAQPTMPGPPPIAKAGGMDISDAFEGLNATPGADGLGSLPPSASGFGNLGGFGGQTGAISNELSYGSMGGGSSFGQPSPELEPTPAAAPSPPRIHHEYGQPNPSSVTVGSSIPEPAPKSSEALAKSYNMSDSTGELEKLKTVLQKLQAENISLKAQLGTMSEEEKDIQKQINATVSEIGDLSNRLTTLRAQVLASKSHLMELTAELKAAHEKKGVLHDLIGEAEATKEAIETAYQGLEASVHAAQAPPPAPAPAFEADLFGFGAAPAPAPAVARAPSHDMQHEHHISAAPPQYPEPTSAPMPAPAPIPYSSHDQGPAGVETVSSDDSSSAGQEHFDENPDGETEHVQPLFSYDAGHAPVQEASNPYQGINFEQTFRSNPPGHNKQSSISSNLSFEVMGGGPVPQNQFAHQQEEDHDYGDDADFHAAPSMDEINELKSKAKEAEDLARDSESTLRQLMARADELRQAADTAELEARQKLAEATEKKGGFMSGGKKKKSMKEATQAKADAEAKKKKFLEAQSQANDAQAVAMETKREAEKLRKQAEQAELDAAAAASMQHKQPAPSPAPAHQTSNGYQNQGHGYGPPQGHGQPHQGYGPPQGYGHGQPPPAYGGGFNPSVMGGGGGGVSIPAPSDDPYANPF